MSVVVASLAAFATTSLRASSTATNRVTRAAVADMGMRIAIEQMRAGATSCAGTGSLVLNTTLQGKSVQVYCSMQNKRMTEAGDFSLVVTGQTVPTSTPTFETNGSNGSIRYLQGHVYLARPPASLSRAARISGGDLWYPPVNGVCTPPNYSNLSFAPVGERGYVCDTTPWSTVAPRPSLPAAPTTVRGQAGTTNASGCTVFQPGIYNAPPLFGAGSENFMQPGVYYFNFSGPITIRRTTVIGGTPGSSPAARTPRTMSTRRCTSAIAAATPNAGITWVLAGGANVYVDSGGELELFGPPNSSTAKGSSIVALPATWNGYAASTLTGTGTPVVTLRSGGSNGIAVHGQVWAPNAYILFENIAGRVNAQFMNTVVAARIDLQTSGRAGGFNIATPVSPLTRVYYLESVVETARVRATARIDSVARTVQISSWTVA